MALIFIQEECLFFVFIFENDKDTGCGGNRFCIETFFDEMLKLGLAIVFLERVSASKYAVSEWFEPRDSGFASNHGTNDCKFIVSECAL